MPKQKRKLLIAFCAFCNKDVIFTNHTDRCPSCGGLRHDNGSIKICATCGRQYPRKASSDIGTEGQDRDNYTDTQDRENYIIDPSME